MAPGRVRPPAALAVAHRGDPYTHRENTLASVASALAKGADVVEVDVRVTRDGVPVLLHDPTLERLWGTAAPVAGLTYRQVAAATRGGVPQLAGALAQLEPHPTARILLDLTAPEQAAPAVAAVREAGLAERVYYCGELSAMRAVRELAADAEIAMTWKTSRRPSDALLAALRPHWLNLPFGLVDRASVAFARERDLMVAAWTADWERSIRRLLDLGVDAVTTNRLDALRRARAVRERRGRTRPAQAHSAQAAGQAQTG